MTGKRKFSVLFKRQVVEENLSSLASIGQLSRRYELSPGLIEAWKRKYHEGTLTEGPSPNERFLESRAAELERMVGRLTMENDLLKKARAFMIQRRNEPSFPVTAKTLAQSNGGAKS